MDDARPEDRIYGMYAPPTLGDGLLVVAGRIMQDLVDMRDTIASGDPQDPCPVPGRALFTAAVLDDTIVITVFLSREAREGIDAKRRAAIRTRVGTVANRYNWKSRTNHADVRFVVRCSVKVIETSMHHLVTGALIG